MAENAGNSIYSGAYDAIGEAKKTAWPVMKDGVQAAQKGLNDSVDYVRETTKSLTDLVERQPLIAVAGAFLVGFLAARMLRRVSS